jgi:hypothetical protein
MTDLFEALKWLLYGFVIGFFFHPMITILRRVYEEFKIAKQEWRQPRG